MGSAELVWSGFGHLGVEVSCGERFWSHWRYSRWPFPLIGLAPDAGAAKPVRDPIDQPVGSSPPTKQAEAIGRGGAVSSVDPYATAVGIKVLRRGGNAADAAIATAAALGVTEPYSAGIGGGGFLVYYNARTGKVSTIDGRETAPASFTPEVFLDGAGEPLVFDNVVNSGLSVGVPGTPALWETARKRFGSWSLNRLLRPAEKLARDGFAVDSTFNAQSAANAARFATFPETERVYLPGGQPAAVGSTFRNPDLARSYRILRRDGVQALYRGRLGAAVVQAARSRRPSPASRSIPARSPRPTCATTGPGRGNPSRAATAGWTSTECPSRPRAGSRSVRR